MKEKVEEEKGKETFPAAGQKLIYAGMFIFLYVCEVDHGILVVSFCYLHFL